MTDPPLLKFLEGLAQRFAIAALDQLWIFPPRRVGNAQSALVVIAAFDGRGERRRVFTAHYMLRHDAHGNPTIQETVTEHGSAPADRISRLMDGVLRRLDDQDAAPPPRLANIQGDPRRWAALFDSRLADSPLP
ncbi:MAG: hypothetical protein HY703_04405 [Gemmatimonadetes bacterium]|nr:hypothetical protein [Gemmatimonadota bacterium]